MKEKLIVNHSGLPVFFNEYGQMECVEVICDQTKSQRDFVCLNDLDYIKNKSISFEIDVTLTENNISKFSMREGGFYASTPPEGGKVLFNRPERGDWEYFYLIDIDFYYAINYLRNTKLFDIDNNRLAEAHIYDGMINVIDQAFPIMGNIEYILSFYKEKNDLCLFKNSYQFSSFSRYNPLLYIACFGDETRFKTAQACLDSFVEIGAYAGDICIITDLASPPLSLPTNYAGKLIITKFVPSGEWEYYFARYKIGLLDRIGSYGPILYVDTDVCCISDINILLQKVQLSGKICVGSEEYPEYIVYPPSLLKFAPSMGSELFEGDQYNPAFHFGFNSGIIAFPSYSIVENAFSLVWKIRGDLPQNLKKHTLDQPIANYVFHKLGIVDYNTISGHILVGSSEALTPHNRPSENQILVHFWRSSSDNRTTDIRNMIEMKAKQKTIEKDYNFNMFSKPGFLP